MGQVQVFEVWIGEEAQKIKVEIKPKFRSSIKDEKIRFESGNETFQFEMPEIESESEVSISIIEDFDESFMEQEGRLITFKGIEKKNQGTYKLKILLTDLEGRNNTFTWRFEIT